MFRKWLIKAQKALNIKGKIDYIKIVSKGNRKDRKDKAQNRRRFLQPIKYQYSANQVLVSRIKNFLKKKNNHIEKRQNMKKMGISLFYNKGYPNDCKIYKKGAQPHF